MKNYDYVLDFMESVKSYYLYLMGVINDNKEWRDYLFQKNYFPGIKTALLSTTLLGFKEKIVNNDGNLQYSSKLYDKVLEDIVKNIGQENNGKFIIDGHEFNNDAEVVSILRNKLAHGDYKINFIDNNIEFNIKNNIVKINIDDMCIFIINGYYSTYKDIKEKTYTRHYCRFENKEKKKKLTSSSDIRSVIKKCHCYIYEIKKIDGSDIDKKYKDILNNYIEYLKEINNQEQEHRTLRNMQINFKNIKLNVSRKRKSIKDTKTINAIETIFNQINDEYDFTYEEQIKQILKITETVIMENMNKFNTDFSNIANLDRVLRLEKEGKNHQIDREIRSEELCSVLVALFAATYIYAFEDLYDFEGNYKYDRQDYFDFSQLNLDNLNVDTLKINTNFIEEAKLKYISKAKKYDGTKTKLIKLNTSLSKISKENVSGINAIKANINNYKGELNKEFKELNEIYNTYRIIQDDYRNNYSYFRNKAIIKGIRDSISHGNYTFIVSEKTFILFKDVYNGEVVMDLKIELYDFIELIENGISSIIKFIDMKNKGIKK